MKIPGTVHEMFVTSELFSLGANDPDLPISLVVVGASPYEEKKARRGARSISR